MNVLVLYSTHITGAHQIKNTTDAYQATIGAHNHVTALPMSDGGQGFLDAIETYATGCRRATVTVRDTHFRLKDTYYITSQDGKTAYIEAFKICGYDHTDPERNPATAFTHGIGDAIADALSHNCRNFVIGIEEIASIDAGLGMLDALGYKILTDNGNELPLYRGSEMLRACAVADSENAALLKRCRFTIACNDDSAFYAATGPAVRHARRLGANEVTTDILDNGLRNMASVYFHHNGRDVSYIKGGETYILDMGSPILIRELAEQMILYNGFEPYKDIPIMITGLREGEKLTEHLFTEEETVTPTGYPKIGRLNRAAHPKPELSSFLEKLRPLCFLDRDRREIYRNRRLLRKLLQSYAPTRQDRPDEPEI